MRFQAVNRCLMASVWWASDFRLSTLGLILVIQTSAVPMNVLLQRLEAATDVSGANRPSCIASREISRCYTSD